MLGECPYCDVTPNMSNWGLQCVYMDDIAIATHTSFGDHVAAVQDVLASVTEHDLYFKPEKCIFYPSSINYLGVILEEGVT